MSEDDLTPEEMQELQAYLGQQGFGTGVPMSEKDKSIVGFFRDIIDKVRLKDTKRGGNLLENELDGVRQYLDISHFAGELGLDSVGRFLEDEALIITDTSLSRSGFLIKMAVTSKRESTAKLGEMSKKKGGWTLFSKKKEGEEE